MGSIVVVTLKSSMSKACRNPSLPPNQPRFYPPVITHCLDSVIG